MCFRRNPSVIARSSFRAKVSDKDRDGDLLNEIPSRVHGYTDGTLFQLRPDWARERLRKQRGNFRKDFPIPTIPTGYHRNNRQL